MKLGELKSKIRAIRGSNPALRIELIPGVTKDILVMKTALIEHLDQIFPDGKSTETGLTLTGAIVHPEVADEPYRQIAANCSNDAEPATAAAQQAAEGISTLLDLDWSDPTLSKTPSTSLLDI